MSSKLVPRFAHAHEHTLAHTHIDKSLASLVLNAQSGEWPPSQKTNWTIVSANDKEQVHAGFLKSPFWLTSLLPLPPGDTSHHSHFQTLPAARAALSH